MSNVYSARNAAEREKLEKLVARLTDEQMGRAAGTLAGARGVPVPMSVTSFAGWDH